MIGANRSTQAGEIGGNVNSRVVQSPAHTDCARIAILTTEPLLILRLSSIVDTSADHPLDVATSIYVRVVLNQVIEGWHSSMNGMPRTCCMLLRSGQSKFSLVRDFVSDKNHLVDIHRHSR